MRGDSQSALDTTLTVGLGVVLGVVARDLPIGVATLAFAGDRRRPCDDAPVECAIAAAPGAIGGLVVFGFLVLLVAAAFAACGALLVAHGLRRRPPQVIDGSDVAATSDAHRLVRSAQLTVGTALVVPALWFVVVVVTSL